MRPYVRRLERKPIWDAGGLTCTVLGSTQLSYGTRGPIHRYVLLAGCRVYTADVDNEDVLGHFEAIEET